MGVRSIIHNMVVDMNEIQLNAMAQWSAYLAGTTFGINQCLLSVWYQPFRG